MPVPNEDADEIVPVKSEAVPKIEPAPEALQEDDVRRNFKNGLASGHGQYRLRDLLRAKDGTKELLFATDCGIVLCAQCWGGYFRAEFSGGVRDLIRCPFPDCNSIVPLWLLEKLLRDVSERRDRRHYDLL